MESFARRPRFCFVFYLLSRIIATSLVHPIRRPSQGRQVTRFSLWFRYFESKSVRFCLCEESNTFQNFRNSLQNPTLMQLSTNHNFRIWSHPQQSFSILLHKLPFMLRNIPILPKNRLRGLTDLILAKININLFIDFFYIRFDSGVFQHFGLVLRRRHSSGSQLLFHNFCDSDQNGVEINAYVFENFESLLLAGSFRFT